MSLSPARHGRSRSYTHTHKIGHAPATFVDFEGAQEPLSILCDWNWGPQLQFTATSDGDHTGDPGKMTGTMRGRFVRPDDYSARPSVWILFAVVTAWQLLSSSPIDRKFM